MCLFFAILGILAGVFLLVVPAAPGAELVNHVPGLILIAICAIPWVRLLWKKSQEQEVSQLQEHLPQAPPQTQPKQQELPPHIPPQSRSRSGVFLPHPLPE